jgi:secondary thiamine-phosphate synthase enzyme
LEWGFTSKIHLRNALPNCKTLRRGELKVCVSGLAQQQKRRTHGVSALSVYKSIAQHSFPASSQDFFSKNPTFSCEKAMSTFRVVNKTIYFHTKGEIDFIDLSEKVIEEVNQSQIRNGVAHVFAPHATGILILTENDPALLNDIKAFLKELVPRDADYQHPSNAHAHLRSMLLPPDKTLPVINSRVEFGMWQSLLFVETDVYPRERTVIIQVLGET